jgi:L-threonylcarbamoyladenylate synthase
MIEQDDVCAAIDGLTRGGLAIVPTDTVYGLAAALDSPEGIAALYTRKGRPRTQPCQVLLYTEALLQEALEHLDEVTRYAALALLPGPATCIVSDPEGRYDAVTGDARGSVGLRAPRMSGAIVGLDIYLVATSANDPGGPDPATVGQVPDHLRNDSAVLDAGQLPGTASAIVDLREVARSGRATLLRPGPNPAAVVRQLTNVGVGQVEVRS